jgi:putative membrane protein
MTMNAFIAFLHHLAAFTIVSCLFAEMLLLQEPLTVGSAKRIQRYDAIYGIAAGAILVLGFLRVQYFEKGADYYFHSAPFLIKLGLFAAVGLLSAYPTVVFFRWGKALKAGQLPEFSDGQRRKVRALIHVELLGLVLIIFNAAMMAKGIRYFS